MTDKPPEIYWLNSHLLYARDGVPIPPNVQKILDRHGCKTVRECADLLDGRAAARKTTPRAEHPSEANLQVSICRYLKTLPNTLYWHCPSSFYRGANSGPGFFGYIAKLKSMGFIPGIPDLIIIFKNVHGATTVCFAELKTKKGVTSEAQNSFLDKANSLGCFTAKVRSIEEMTELLKKAQHQSFR